MGQPGILPARFHPASNLSHFSIILAFLLLLSLLGICKILPSTRLPGPMVALPEFDGRSATTAPQGPAVVISLTRYNKIYLNDGIVGIQELIPKLVMLRSTHGNAPLYLKMDKRVPYGMVIDIWQFARTQQVEIVSLAVAGRDSFDQRIVQVQFGYSWQDYLTSLGAASRKGTRISGLPNSER